MRTKIFGIGLAKTGTTSLHFGLEILGFRSIHAASLLSNVIADEIRAHKPLLTTLEDTYDSFIDWPISYLYPQLDARIPDSKFILTVRDPKERYRSALRHVEVDRHRRANGLSFAWLSTESEAEFIAETERHEAAVRAYFASRPDKLLVIRIVEGEGWEQLCTFLMVPVPPKRFPSHKALGSHQTHFIRTSEIPLTPSTDDGWPPKVIASRDLILGEYKDPLTTSAHDFTQNWSAVYSEIQETNKSPFTIAMPDVHDREEIARFLMASLHSLAGNAPPRDVVAIIALCSKDGVERNYMCERLRRGWPSLFANEQDLPWRAHPGFYEWYLRLRYNNPLFYPLRRCVSHYDLYLARQMDDSERTYFVNNIEGITAQLCIGQQRPPIELALEYLYQITRITRAFYAGQGGETVWARCCEAKVRLCHLLARSHEHRQRVAMIRDTITGLPEDVFMGYVTGMLRLPSEADFQAALRTQSCTARPGIAEGN